MDRTEKVIHFGELVVPRDAKENFHAFMEWCLRMGIKEVGHTVAPILSSKLRAKPISIKEFDRETFEQGSELDGSSFATGGGRVVNRSKVLAVPDLESKWFVFPDHDRKGTLYILAEMITPEGIAMDGRKPLKMAQKVLEETLKELCSSLGLDCPREGEKYTLISGFEKEFFIIPRHVEEERPDLKYLGMTVVGEPGPINQNLQGVYLTIPKLSEEALLGDIVREMAAVGITVTQNHLEVGQTGNELQGRQCEIVLKYAPALQAADNELIARQILEDVCHRHGYRALIGSKSFTESSKGEGINGSGKHTNISVVKYDSATGQITDNLLSIKELKPDPSSPVNLIGLAMVAAMGRHWQVYDASIASRGNELRRRPGYEAPVYLSAFIGSTAEFRDSLSQDRNRSVSIGISGNKLEWRAPGANVAMYYPLAFLALGIAEVIREVTAALKGQIEKGAPLQEAVVAEYKRLREEIDYFIVDEDVYELSKEEAEKRFGYRAPENTPEALVILDEQKKIEFLINDGVFNEEMIQAFKQVQMENYVERVKAEAIIMAQMSNVLCNKVFRSTLMQIQPAHLKDVEPRLRERQAQLGALNADLLMKVDGRCTPEGKESCNNLRGLLAELRKISSVDEAAQKVVKELLPLMAEVRALYEDIVTLIGGSEEVTRI
jgi:glutamine synthetase